ncbi:MAG: sulfotransferase [Acidobacteria bacterium]|nr:sulfotransferase [Acidobacteriota bacterium]
MSIQIRPNLFVVGAPKCGTTSLHSYLAQHPQVFMSALKEPRFWSDDLRAQGRAFHRSVYRRHIQSLRGLLTLPSCIWGQLRANPTRRLGIEELDAYLSLFEQADPKRHRYVGESSADSMWSEQAAGRIAEFCPDARIIIMLREPLSYIVSIYREALSGKVGEQVTSLERALALEPQRRLGNAVPCTARYPFSVCYRLQAHFDDQVQRFLDVFDRRQIHFILLEDLAEDAIQCLNHVFSFLELPAIAGGLDLEPRNVGNPSRPTELSLAWRKTLREEMGPVVARLEQQTGLDLGRRWGYP